MTCGPSLHVKHTIDRVAACALLLILAPLLAVIAVAIRLDSTGSPLFLQWRAGQGGRPFRIFKFRTMRQGSEHTGLGAATAAGDDRITRVGRWLRATSLDELPQLLNIARGEMSFVGPRPTLPYQVESYTPEQRRRLLLRPGITGWAQVHGRNEIPWERRIELDLEYIDGYTLATDVRIVLRTLAVLLRRDGIYASAGANDTFAPGGTGRAEERSRREHQTTALAAVPALSPLSGPRVLAPDAPAVAPRPLLVVGGGGHARVVLDIVEKQGRYAVTGILDERSELRGTSLMGYPILGGRDVLDRDGLPDHAFVAIGSPRARQAWQEELEARGFRLAVLVHPSAQVSRDVALGPGTVLMAGAIVNAGSRLDRGVIVNTAASVDHDCSVGAFVHVAPGAHLAGAVRVGPRAHVGIGACVIQCIEVGADAIVGAGAAVVRAVAPGITVGGVPARPLRSLRGASGAPAQEGTAPDAGAVAASSTVSPAALPIEVSDPVAGRA